MAPRTIPAAPSPQAAPLTLGRFDVFIETAGDLPFPRVRLDSSDDDFAIPPRKQPAPQKFVRYSPSDFIKKADDVPSPRIRADYPPDDPPPPPRKQPDPQPSSPSDSPAHRPLYLTFSPTYPLTPIDFTDSDGGSDTKNAFICERSRPILDVILLLQADAFISKAPIHELKASHNGHAIRNQVLLNDIFQNSSPQSLAFERGGEWPSETIKAIVNFRSDEPDHVYFPSVCSLGFLRAYLAITRKVRMDSIKFDLNSLNARLKSRPQWIFPDCTIDVQLRRPALMTA
jgi:hypothetical protein